MTFTPAYHQTVTRTLHPATSPTSYCGATRYSGAVLHGRQPYYKVDRWDAAELPAGTLGAGRHELA